MISILASFLGSRMRSFLLFTVVTASRLSETTGSGVVGRSRVKSIPSPMTTGSFVNTDGRRDSDDGMTSLSSSSSSSSASLRQRPTINLHRELGKGSGYYDDDNFPDRDDIPPCYGCDDPSSAPSSEPTVDAPVHSPVFESSSPPSVYPTGSPSDSPTSVPSTPPSSHPTVSIGLGPGGDSSPSASPHCGPEDNSADPSSSPR